MKSSFNVHDIRTVELLVFLHNIGACRLDSVNPFGTGGRYVNFWEVKFEDGAE